MMYALLDQPRLNATVILLDVEWIETPQEFLTTMAAELLAIDRIRKLFASAGSLTSGLSRWISNAIDEVGVGISGIGEMKIRLRQNLNNGEAWADLAEQMLRTLRHLPEHVVLILDEFPMMISGMLDRDPATAIRFLRWFRTFRQSPGTERLTFLLGGSTNIEPRLESLATEAVLGDLQRFRIMPFPPPKALAFLKELLLQERVSIEPGVPDEIFAVCHSGIPYYLQTVVAECLAEARRLERPLAAVDIRAVYEERVIGPINRHRFSHYHTRLKLHYGSLEMPARVVLADLCSGPKSIEDLRTSLVANGNEPSVIDRLLVLLEGDYYIVRDGQSVMFSDGLLRDWWIRNSVPPKVKL